MPWAIFIRGAWEFFKFPIGVPLGVLLAAGIYLWFNQGAAERAQEALRQAVAGAEMAELKARNAYLQYAQSREQARVIALQEANERFERDRLQSQAEAQDAKEYIEQLLSQPVDGDCAVTPDLGGRLRNR